VEWAGFALAVVGAVLGVYNAWRARSADLRTLNVWAAWDRHAFDDDSPIDSIRLTVVNDGKRPVELRHAGWLFTGGLTIPDAAVDGLTGEPLSDGRDRELWLHPPPEHLVSQHGWPARAYVQDATRRRFDTGHPGRLAPGNSDGDF
jgi:hypothetical protein